MLSEFSLLRLLAVAQRFLRRQASISELRAAVRECERELAATTQVRDGGHGE